MSITTREQLIAALESDAESFQQAVAELPEEAFESGVYEQGWNARQLLAHIAAIEWTYPRLIEQARQSDNGNAARSGAAAFDMDAYNAKQVARREDQPAAQLLTEFQRNRAQTIDAIRAAEESLLAQQIHSVGGVAGTLLEVLNEVAITHVREHMKDLLKASPPRSPS